MFQTVTWSARSVALAVASLVAIETGAGCAATAPDRLRVVTAPRGVVTRLADLDLEPGTVCRVTLVSGSNVHGRLVSLTPSELVLGQAVQGRPDRLTTLPDAEIVRVARVVGFSKPARSCLGAVVGSLLSLPFAISQFADMVVPGAILGSLLGRGTGDSRLEVLLQR